MHQRLAPQEGRAHGPSCIGIDGPPGDIDLDTVDLPEDYLGEVDKV